MEASQPNFGCHYQPKQRDVPFGSFHELPNSLLGLFDVAKITAMSKSRVGITPFENTEEGKPNIGRHYQPQQRTMSFVSFNELPKSLLVWCEVAKIRAMSGSRVASHHATLWKQASRILDVTISHNREPCLLFPFTDFQNRCLGGVRSPRSQA